ncbi:hypothetical protein HGB07_08635, partial [Candidatus Roizmanbacteria bacterium]|nr:hypothetical protein [Candidatus Roizmanbacteria bacterium]
MKILKVIIPLLLLALIIWIDFPENYRVKFAVGNLKVNTVLNPPVIDWNLGGSRIVKRFNTQLGLDLKGGSHLVFQADTSKVKSTDLQEALNSARDIIEKRVNYFGVSEPSIQTVKSGGSYRIIVELPGITDVAQAVSLIGQTAQLSFKEEDPTIKIASDTPEIVRLQKNTGLTGNMVKKASVVFNSQTGKPEVSLEFTKEGANLFGDITTRNVGKKVGIFIDYFPISAPTVTEPILNGSASINGSFTVEEAKQLATSINSGALPLPVTLVEQRNIGPTLGANEVR